MPSETRLVEQYVRLHQLNEWKSKGAVDSFTFSMSVRLIEDSIKKAGFDSETTQWARNEARWLMLTQK